MAFSATIGGTSFRCVDDYSIKEQSGAVSTSSISCLIEEQDLPVIYQKVLLYIDEELFFQGVVRSVGSPTYDTSYETNVFTVEISSLEFLLQTRLMTKNFYYYTYESWTEVIQYIFDNYISEENITLGEISVTTDTFDSKYETKNDKVSDILDDIADQIGNAVWWIDKNRAFYFKVATDFDTATVPDKLTNFEFSSETGDIRTVQTIIGASSGINATETNTALLTEIAARTGGSGKIEVAETESSIYSDLKADALALSKLDAYAEEEQEISCLCHDLANSALNYVWPLDLTLNGIEVSGDYVITERKIKHRTDSQLNITVKLKNRNYFARYGYTIKSTLTKTAALDSTLTQIFDDNSLTPDEKITLSTEVNTVTEEYAVITAKALARSVPTTDVAPYKEAYTELYNYCYNSTDGVLNSLVTTDDVDGDEIKTLLATYYTQEQILNAVIASQAIVIMSEIGYLLGDNVGLYPSFIDDDTIIFSNNTDGQKLYKQAIGEDTTPEAIGTVAAICPCSDRHGNIVYVNQEDGSTLYHKSDSDTGTGTRVLTHSVFCPVIVNDDEEYTDIYYINPADGFKIYHAEVSGSVDEAVTDFAVRQIAYINGYLIYTKQGTGDTGVWMRAITETDPSETGAQIYDSVVMEIAEYDPTNFLFTKADDGLIYYKEMVDISEAVEPVSLGGYGIQIAGYNTNIVYSAPYDSSYLFYYTGTEVITDGHLEGSTNESTVTGNVTTGSNQITGISLDDMGKIATGDVVTGAGLLASTTVIAKAATSVTISSVAISTITDMEITVTGSRIYLSANKVIVDGSITAELMSASAISSKAVVEDEESPNYGKSITDANLDTGEISCYDTDGTRKMHLNPQEGEFSFGGDLEAAGGTFSGDLNAAGGTFEGTLSAGTVDASKLTSGCWQFVDYVYSDPATVAATVWAQGWASEVLTGGYIRASGFIAATDGDKCIIQGLTITGIGVNYDLQCLCYNVTDAEMRVVTVASSFDAGISWTATEASSIYLIV